MSPSELDHSLAVGFGLARAGLPSALSFHRWMRLALAGRRRSAAIALRLVNEEEGRELNRQFRGRDYATNVLSFPADMVTPKGNVEVLGDIAICAPVVLREAAEQAKSARTHFAHMTLHGVLHLLGHDHIEEADANRMESLEIRLLAKLGMANPYRIC